MLHETSRASRRLTSSVSCIAAVLPRLLAWSNPHRLPVLWSRDSIVIIATHNAAGDIYRCITVVHVRQAAPSSSTPTVT
jgi:hypothetical protein